MKEKRSYAVTETISRLLNTQPFYACLLLDLLKLEESTVVPTAGTDGRRIIINPDWFGKLSVDERLFVMCHEVLHVIFRHPCRGKGYADRGIGPDFKLWSHRRWNIAGDYVINARLIHDHIGTMPVGGLHNPRFTHEMQVDEVYVDVPDEPPQQGGGGGQGRGPQQGQGTDQQGNPGDGWDSHIFGDPSDAPSPAEIQQAVQGAAAAAKAVGKMPASMKRLVDGICEPQVKWHEEVRLAIHRVAGRDASTWSRPNRRRIAVAPHIYWPGTESHQAGCVVQYEDTSGSVSDTEMKHWRGEMVGVWSELNPQELWVGSCDAKAYDPEQMFDMADIESYESKGGGGTHMPAIFDKLEELNMTPDVLIILTDGYTDFGDPPPYPVIWVITSDKVAPHGQTIRLRMGGQ